MATADQIAARIELLKEAISSEVLIVRHGDTSTQFRSVKEMSEALALLQADLNAANGVPRQRVRYISQSDKGL